MFFFKTRSAARSFSSKQTHYIVKDNGNASPANRRWGVSVLTNSALILKLLIKAVA